MTDRIYMKKVWYFDISCVWNIISFLVTDKKFPLVLSRNVHAVLYSLSYQLYIDFW